ncbi:MAG: anthranilate synthase component I family protein [Gammaproteobacteria bacterium]|nr:anthranilate synthase component I family protein [Gammaproteobacteria bacterium]MBT8151973.1 anthranilate synthase component I family protein [Gammaproteobacteria bacterium]NND38917.1 anthranilate synthase component I family protein [Pseudomonadales bacterium]NNM12378.1 anthranilate synthase component I family protein [Pseudomonadales bacterium]RZV55397.1 MAG: anthranilate synthase component I family protein [Pseudomonadales bacterium]
MQPSKIAGSKTRCLDLPYYSDSLLYLARVVERPYPVMLSSANSSLGRYDILSAAPVALIEADSQVLDAVDDIAAGIARFTSPDASALATELPFVSGAIGLFGYHAGEQLHGITAAKDSRWPAVHAGIYQWALVQDHHLRRCTLVADAKLDNSSWRDLQQTFANARASKTRIERDLRVLGEWQNSLPYANYAQRFASLQDYILAGDCYQANLTREFSASYVGDPCTALQDLHAVSKTPFAAFVRRPQADLICASPERFISVENGVALSQPIKGSRPRGSSASEDATLIAELVASEKDRAENLMIVDLLRNDFGKLCKTGSVSVPELFQVQSFSNVHHLVSTIRGELPDAAPKTALSLLAACMPGGSITGAPKRRAMQIIAELEPHQRAVYCGALFYLNGDGKLDSNILIRSLLFDRQRHPDARQGKVYCWSGGGIVADSNCEEEFAESNYKVAHLLDALNTPAAHSTPGTKATQPAKQ